jgi:hypothetical protein
MLQVSQSRLTHLMALRLLCPDVQQAILLDEVRFGDKELRALAASRTGASRRRSLQSARRRIARDTSSADRTTSRARCRRPTPCAS